MNEWMYVIIQGYSEMLLLLNALPPLPAFSRALVCVFVALRAALPHLFAGDQPTNERKGGVLRGSFKNLGTAKVARDVHGLRASRHGGERRVSARLT